MSQVRAQAFPVPRAPALPAGARRGPACAATRPGRGLTQLALDVAGLSDCAAVSRSPRRSATLAQAQPRDAHVLAGPMALDHRQALFSNSACAASSSPSTRWQSPRVLQQRGAFAPAVLQPALEGPGWLSWKVIVWRASPSARQTLAIVVEREAALGAPARPPKRCRALLVVFERARQRSPMRSKALPVAAQCAPVKQGRRPTAPAPALPGARRRPDSRPEPAAQHAQAQQRGRCGGRPARSGRAPATAGGGPGPRALAQLRARGPAGRGCRRCRRRRPAPGGAISARARRGCGAS